MPWSYHLIVPMPAGRSTTQPDVGRLSILFVPRLDDDGVLTDWTNDWRNWPKVVRGIAPASATPLRLNVLINGVAAVPNSNLDVTSPNWASDPPQPAVWDTMFGTALGGKPIAVRRFRPILRNSDSIAPVFDAPQLAADLRSIYQALADSPLPPAPGSVPALSPSLVSAYDSHMAPTGAGDVDGEDTPVDADFHQAITFVQAHPHLLRVLGLVVDLEVALPPGPASVAVQSNYQANYGPNRAVPCRVAVDTDFWPTTGPGRWADVGPSTHRVEMLDLGGGISALQDTGGGGRAPEQVSIATPSNAGLYLTRSGIDLLEELTARFERQEIFEEHVSDVLGGLRSPPVDVVGDELGVGRRYDVYDATVDRWFSLWDRTAPEGYRFPNEPSLSISPPDDEGWITYTAMTESHRSISGSPAPPPGGEGPIPVPPLTDDTELRVSPVLFSWRGWSHAARPPGRAFSGIAGPVEVEPNEPDGMPVQMAVDYEVVDGVLPRLRYTRTYKFRARFVDFAGNSRRVDESTPGGVYETPPIVFGRTSRLPAPTPVRRLPRPVPGWGDTTSTLVVKSEPGQDDATVEPTWRLLYPPSASQFQCELHGFPAPDGLFTTPDVFADVVARTAVSIETQTTTDPVTGELLQIDPDDWTPRIDYLLEPAASGVGFRQLPGAGPDAVTVPLPGAWPTREGVGIEVRAGEGPPTTSSDPAAPAVVCEVPKGITRRVQVASLIDPALVRHWTFFEQLPLARRNLLNGTVTSGGHWLFSATTELTVLHAVRQPLAAPRVIGGLLGDRVLGRTQASCSGTFGLDVKSTDRILLTGTWTDPVDTPGAPGGVSDRTSTRLLFAQREPYREVVQRPIDDTPFETGDTKRHEARVTLEAFSRYARYFTERSVVQFAALEPVLLAAEGISGDNVIVRQDGRIASPDDYVVNGATGTIRRTPGSAIIVGQDVEVDFIRLPISRRSTELPGGGVYDLTIPNGGVPDAVAVEEVLPAFARSTVASGDSITVEHNGQTLRVWVARPWFTTGVGELLGVLVGDRPDGPVSQVARDPLSPSGPAGPLTVDDFPGATTTDPSIDGTALGVAGHPVAFDDDRQLWFADIEIDADLGYRPFVQLALVRYQPVSVEGAKIGDVVITEPVRIGSSRTTTLQRSGTTLEVEVTGLELRNEVVARFQESDPDIADTDLSWHDLDDGVVLTSSPSAGATTWSASLTLPVSERPVRLVLEDAELLDRTVGGVTQLARSISYVEAVDLDGAWTAPPPEPPSAVTGLVGTARNQAAALSWSAPADDGGSAVLRYAVERRIGSGAWGDQVVIEPPMTTRTIDGLTNGTTYGFRVRAENAVGPGAWSAEVLVTPAVTAPDQLTDVQARGGHRSVLVSWPVGDDGGSPLTGYRIERRTGTGAWGNAETLPPSRRSHVTRQLTNGTTYGFRVRGENALGVGPWSDEATATPAVMVPGRVQRVQGVSGRGAVALRWRAAAPRGSAVVRYRIERRLAPTAPWGTPVVVDGTTTSTVIQGLPTGASVGFRVRAENSVGAGAYSTPIIVTVVGGGAAPEQVQGVQVTAGDGSLTVSWLEPGDGGSPITAFEVELRRPNGTVVSTAVVGGDQLVHEFTGLANGSVYGARVRAVNVVGNGPWSAPAAGSPQP